MPGAPTARRVPSEANSTAAPSASPTSTPTMAVPFATHSFPATSHSFTDNRPLPESAPGAPVAIIVPSPDSATAYPESSFASVPLTA